MSAEDSLRALYEGSSWHRWEPHIHAPGTVLNDQFKATDFDDYLAKLEAAKPTIRALGVTDYYSLDCYERVCTAKGAGRLPQCDLIFPNIEMRFSIGTIKNKWVNFHLLVSPQDSNHIVELRRVLALLRFNAKGDSYTCSRDDLIRLGRQHDPKLIDEIAALKCGSTQFKVSLDDLKGIFTQSDWAKSNILIGLAGSETDGSSGVRDAADQALREEIERFADVIFASSDAQREFWSGQRGLDEAALRAKYRTLKPCLHGSDAHDLKGIGAPDGNRYCWVKGEIAFDTLRQACIDPGRAFVGVDPPVCAVPSQTIASVAIKAASWMKTPEIVLNPGLVAIIGARGSGKTALADMIALGCDAMSDQPSQASFLTRAEPLVGDATACLRWHNGDQRERRLDQSDEWSAAEYPRARYLSQQFVEELCSAQGITDSLMQEMERVIFESHSAGDKDGAAEFSELLEIRTTRLRAARDREEILIAALSERISGELEKRQLVKGLAKQFADKQQLITGYTNDRSKLVSKGSEERVKKLAELAAAAEKVRSYLRFFAAQEQSLLSLQDEVQNVRTHQAPEGLRRTQERYKASALAPTDWPPFLLDYKGNVDASLATHLAKCREGARTWKGTPQLRNPDLTVSRLAANVGLDQQPLSHLEAEIDRLEKQISIDSNTAKAYATLSKRINEENAHLERLKARHEDCLGAEVRARELFVERDNAYARVFETVGNHQQVLLDLYGPLMSRLAAASGTLQKLSFSVVREVNAAQWAAEGERLLDLRLGGKLKGRGTLLDYTNQLLVAAWKSGDANTVRDAMAAFQNELLEELLKHAPIAK
ncbi:MAG TPA: ATP-binding protein, partial [Hyphomicrobium sp.]